MGTKTRIRQHAAVAPVLAPAAAPTEAPMLMLFAGLQQQVLALEARVRALETERHAPPAPAPTAPLAPLEAHRMKERETILAALEETGWNRLEAARKLAIPRRTFYRKLEEHGIQQGDTRTGVAKREKERAKG